MELIRGLHNLRPRHRGCVATIGNFDGVHLGHQAVLASLGEQARSLTLPLTVITFEPMPREFFSPEKAPLRIASLREKLEDLAQAQVDRVLCVRFDRRFADLSPQAFIDEVLVGGLGVRYLTVGDDFRFGHRREGDFALLRKAGMTQGFAVESLPSFCAGGARVSSSQVRKALAAGEPGKAAALLGRPYRITGRVAAGQRLGRELGVPTANLPLTRTRAARQGVYAARVDTPLAKGLPAAVNLGTRPTVAGGQYLLEAHVLDFDGSLYGQRIAVQLLDFLRPELRFADLESLRVQMMKDITDVRSRLGN